MRLYISGFRSDSWRERRPYVHLAASPVLEPVQPPRFVESWFVGLYVGSDLIASFKRYWNPDDRTQPQRYSFRVPAAPELLTAAAFAASAVFLLLHG